MALCIDNLTVEFSGKRILDALNLEIPSGGPSFLLGPSGSGKTTLLRAINRLNECLPGCVTHGQIRLQLGGEWREIYAPGYPVARLRQQVGMVFQNPNVLPLSIARNIALPLSTLLSLSADDIGGRIENVLREVHLWEEVCDRLNTPAQSLSGGQQQRLCLARALALGPEILLLDEPTASLDVKAARQIEELLASFASRYTVLIVSHSLSQAQRLAKQVFMLHAGQRIECLPEDKFRDRHALLAMLDEMA